nr:hypothetical protein [Bacteroidota bacterium]
ADAYALNIRKGEKELFRLPNDPLDPSKSLVTMDIKARLKTDRNLSVNVEADYTGTSSANMRETFSRVGESGQKKYLLESLGKGSFPNIELASYSFSHLRDISDTLSGAYTINSTGFADKIASLYIIRVPFMISIQPNPALLSKTRYNRLYLPEIGPTEPCFQKVLVELPAGYRLMEVPADVLLKSKFGTYSLRYRNTSQGLIVERYQAYSTDEISIDEFEEFKVFYAQMLEADTQRLAVQRQ